MKRGTLVASAALAAAAVLTLPAAAPASTQAGSDPASGTGLSALATGELRDLQPEAANPTDGASAALVAVARGGSTDFRLTVWGLDRSSAGRTFGVHAHQGPCVAGNGDAAGDHYNTGGPPSPDTEVWLDFTTRPGGVAHSSASTPFVVPEGGARSIVIHENPTSETGSAGDRIACLPVDFGQSGPLAGP